MARKTTSWPLAPLLLGIYPVVHLYSVNLDRVNPPDVVMPLLVGFAIAVGLTALASALCRSLSKGAIVTSVLLFSSYFLCGVADTMLPWLIEGVAHPFWDTALTVIPFAIALGTYVLIRPLKDVRSWTYLSNAVMLVLLVVPIARLIEHRSEMIHEPPPLARNVVARRMNNASTPDVYYIILDGYTREDILKNDLGYDNSAFIHFLRDRGFYVADQSRSNYAYTYLSLASSLNISYLDNLNSNPDQQAECLRRIRENGLMKRFQSNGYQTIHFASGWSVTDYSPYADIVISSHHLNEFHGLLLRSSLLRLMRDRGMAHAGRERLLYSLSQIGPVSKRKEATFAFIHLLCPHPPYIFDRHGNLPPPKTYATRPKGSRDWYPKERYVDQLDYLNTRIEDVIDRILKGSSQPPIIVLQGDHGAACDGTSAHPTALMVRERMGILNAYYVPPAIREKLYPTISPVNSFRLILRYIFKLQIPLLPDKHYYSGPMDATPYHFIEEN